MKSPSGNSLGIICLLAPFFLGTAGRSRATDCLTPPPGLVAWWRGEGDASDSISTNHGSATNIGYAGGMVGQAFVFNGTNSAITVPSSSSLTVQSLTIEAWIYPTDISTPRPIVEFAGPTGLAWVQFWYSKTHDGTSPGSLYAAFRFPPATVPVDFSAGSIPANRWSHVALTFDQPGHGASLYVNGAWVGGIGGWAGNLKLTTACPVNIGYRPVGSTEGMAGARDLGLLDEVSIYNRALSATEISALYNAGSAGKCIGPIPPDFLSQPVGSTNVAGTTASFSIQNRGTLPLTYQWQKDGVNLMDGGDISGSATAQLTLRNVRDSDAGNYTVALTNAFGSAVSSPAELAVLDKPVIFQQPVNSKNVNGSTATFNVTAFGGNPLNYQWQRNDTNLTDSAKVSGATASTLTLSGVSPDDEASFRVVVSNAWGSVVSSNALLTVEPAISVAWGSDDFGATNVPPDLTNAIAVSAGAWYTLALRSDGTVTAWGDDEYGECDVPPGLSNVVAVSAGWAHSLALTADGRVFAWGAGTTNSGTWPDFGQCLVPASATNVVAIQAGYRNSMAMQADGRVIEWGYNGYDQTNVPSSLTNAVAIAGANDFSLALRADGTVAMWGAHYIPGPGVPPDGLSNVVAISAGRFHSLALKSDGTVVAWGENNFGEGVVPPGLSNVVAISAGLDFFNLAMKSDGTVVAWGDNTYGELNVPVGVSYATAISAGLMHGVAALVNNGLPLVLKQPADQQAISGGTSSFSVRVAGAPQLTYQWLKNGTGLSDGTNVAGATTSKLVLKNVQSVDAAIYSVAVTNISGSVTSAPALLTTLVAPAINAQPASQTRVLGTEASFPIIASGTDPLSYHWRRNGIDLESSGNVFGATTRDLTLTNVSLDDSGNYTVVVTNLAGSVTSSVAVLSITVPAPSIVFERLGGDSFQLTFPGPPGAAFRIQRSETLSNPTWQDVATQFVDSSGICSYLVSSASNAPSRFYRAVWP